MDLTQTPTEKLRKTVQTLKFITGLLLGTLITLFGNTLYISIKDGFTPLFVVSIALLPIVFINFGLIKKLKAELSSRAE